MLRRLGIRAKVLAVLAVPMLVVLFAGAFVSWETITNLRGAQDVHQVVSALSSYVAVNDALNDERAITQTGGSATAIHDARAKTDEAIATFRPQLDAINLAPYSRAVAAAVTGVQDSIDSGLPAVRIHADGGETRIVRSQYDSIITQQLVLLDNLAQELSNRGVATHVTAYADVARTVGSLVQEQVDAYSLLTDPNPTAAVGDAYTTLVSQTEAYRETARPAVAGLGIQGVALPSTDPSAEFTNDRQLIGTGAKQVMSVVIPNDFNALIASQRQSLSQVSNGVLHGADQVAAAAVTAAQQRAVLTGGVTILAIVLSVVLATVISRTIVVPLRRLTAAATDLREELPRLVEQVQIPGEGPQMFAPQIPVTSRDEVGRLAGAFNAVNQTTFQVAQEQAALRGSIAEMFVNVARRDQVLLNRQLSFIDSLERTEEDPQALANLFRLDHLATRMRRNAESLLVLAGIDSGRRLRDALPLSDVVRTASSEIEQYDRVELDLQADPHMLGFNALPAAHLLAELLENATVFSEPETPVIVTTSVSGAHVEVRIADQGLGMSDAELAAANEKIVATSAGDALGAQRLGLFVVGRLAQRLGAEVRLRKNTEGSTGTVTVVRFPATLFQSTEASPLGSYGDAAARADVPVLTEVDLAALTEGVTDQGLPRRRGADAGRMPERRPARGSFDENAIVLPDVNASALPADLGGAAGDWSPLVVPEQEAAAAARGSDLPSRQPAASTPTVPGAGSGRVPAAADPATRAGLFAGFRGRVTANPDAGAPQEPPEPALVIPGLAPDEDWAPGQTATDLWSVGEESAQHAVSDEAFTPSPAAHAWEEQPREEYVPASFVPDEPSASGPLFERPTPEPWAPAEPAVTTPAAVPAGAHAAAQADEPTVERWTPPEVDLSQWSVPADEAPAFEPQPDAFSGLTGWAGPAAEVGADATPFAPFGRSLDEAQAWATGAIPVVPEPAGFPDAEEAAAPAEEELIESSAWSSEWSTDREPWSVPLLEPDPVFEGATSVLPPVADEEPAYEPAAASTAAPVEPEPADELPATPGWAPVAAESFSDLVRGDEPQPARRRGLFGRRKERQAPPRTSAPAAFTPPPVAEPVPVAVPVPATPVRSSAWAPAASPVTPEPFPRHELAPVPVSAAPVAPAPAPAPAPTPAAPAPAVASASWGPQASWNPPAPAALNESGRTAPSWTNTDWAPRSTHPTGPIPTVPSSSAPEPSSGPRIGTLDDEVAAMLALRSDIQEQALSELSQLSAYRPQVMPGADRLTRRVPTAVPEAPEIVESGAERDPDVVRSKLASFQSGTVRGRRDSGRGEETS